MSNSKSSNSLNPLNSKSMSNNNSNSTVLGSTITSKGKVNVGEWVAYCEQHLYNYVETAKCLAYAWNTQTSIANVFLTGSAGYGKSDGAKLFCKFLFDKKLICCEEPFVLSCSIGTNETILLGGINIGKFTKEGFLEYLLENSFLNHDFFVLEEGLDMPPQVLAVLKDILTAGEFRAGGQTYPVKTKMSIICTNKSIAEVATDKSITAIFERFVFKNEVKWTSHEKEDYFAAARLFFNYAKTKTGIEVNDDMINRVAMATVLSNKETQKIISPRIMIAAVQAYVDNGSLDPLNFIEGYLGKYLVQNVSEIQREKIMKEYNKFISYVPNSFADLVNLAKVKQEFSDYTSGIEYQAANIDLKELMDNAFEVQEKNMEGAMGFTKTGAPSKFKETIAAELGCKQEDLRTVGIQKWADETSTPMEELTSTVEWLLTEAN